MQPIIITHYSWIYNHISFLEILEWIFEPWIMSIIYLTEKDNNSFSDVNQIFTKGYFSIHQLRLMLFHTSVCVLVFPEWDFCHISSSCSILCGPSIISSLFCLWVCLSFTSCLCHAGMVFYMCGTCIYCICLSVFSSVSQCSEMYCFH